MAKQVSQQRKAVYYVGMALIGIGLISFLSTFVTFIANIGNFSDFDGRMKSCAIRAFGGMLLIFIGAIVSNIGARDAAGSGIVLDPEKAREDLEPYSRMAGGMIKDIIDEADINLGSSKRERVIMIKCQQCGKLNEEDSKFCQECGKPI